MAKSVQIRNMPEKLHRTLKTRAAQAGLTLSEYLVRELKKSTVFPSEDELWNRIRSRTPVKGVSGSELVREGREERESRIDEWVDRLGSRR